VSDRGKEKGVSEEAWSVKVRGVIKIFLARGTQEGRNSVRKASGEAKHWRLARRGATSCGEGVEGAKKWRKMVE